MWQVFARILPTGLFALNNTHCRVFTFYSGERLLDWVMDKSLRRTEHKGTTKVERHHKFAKHLAFGAGGHLRSNNPADQEKAIVYNELVTNAVALQNVVNQTQALHVLKSKGIVIRPSDLVFLSPYATSKLKRFGEYPTDLKPDAMPTQTTLPT